MEPATGFGPKSPVLSAPQKSINNRRVGEMFFPLEDKSRKSKTSQFDLELYGYSRHTSQYRDQPMPSELVTFKGHDGRNTKTKDTV